MEEAAARLAEEKRKTEDAEAARLAEEKGKAGEAEAARLAEKRNAEAEAARLAEEHCQADQAARLTEEDLRADKASRRKRRRVWVLEWASEPERSIFAEVHPLPLNPRQLSLQRRSNQTRPTPNTNHL